MKKISTVAALLGAAAIVWLACKVVNFGGTNMRRAAESNYQWRISWADRR